MNTLSRTITGTLVTLLGISISIVSFSKEPWATYIYGIPLTIIGVYILFNKKEDFIEKIKKIGRK